MILFRNLSRGFPRFKPIMMDYVQVVLVERRQGDHSPFGENKSNDILHLIHSNICGPMPVNSIGGHLYYITFIDEFSRKTWIYYLKHKDEAFKIFKEFKTLIEREESQNIQV